MKASDAVLLGLSLSVLVACAEREDILPGERQPIRAGTDGLVIADAATDVAEAPVPLSLPAPQRLAAWPMRVGNAQNDPGHATLSAQPQLMWSASIGAGDSRRLRITADPVSDGTRIYTLDAKAQVTATLVSGQALWSRSLVPATERDNEASGGGLAIVDGTLYVTTGYGRLHALDPASGNAKWVQRLDAPITTPKVANGLVYVVSRDSRAWAINAETGRLQWDIPASPSTASMATSPAPAIAGRLAIFPYGSGEIIATLQQSGIRVWGSSVSGKRRGVASNFVGDITGDPVATGSTVYAGTTAGRMVALSQSSGTRLWTIDEGAVSPVTVAGGSVFAVTDRAQLVRVDAAAAADCDKTAGPFAR
ncbi:MAG: PQQ-binding-like beta-propeller repeat protein [Pseudomonadota bacterium]